MSGREPISTIQFVSLSGANRRDDIFKAIEQPGDFVFSKDVFEVFPDMIGRSVPGYWDNVSWIGQLAQQFITPGGLVYDLGCSLGAVGWSVDRHLQSSARIVAVDNANAMTEGLILNLQMVTPKAEWSVTCADVASMSFETCSVVVLHYCLQFIPIEKRTDVLKRLFEAIEPGGALFLSEKIAGETEIADRWLRDAHHAFKRSMGYSEQEIERKATSISTMMPVERASMHERRLLDAGFSTVTRWRQSLNFCSWIAVK